MDAFLLSTLVVAIAEVGDKSLFFAILLTVRCRRPWPVFWGLVVGMLANLSLAALVGSGLAIVLDGAWLAWLIGIAFLGMAAWSLRPESTEPPPDAISRGGIFCTATAGFFLLEMADKTQIATMALAAAMENYPAVVLGATLGVVLVNAPAIWLGHRFASRLPMTWMRKAAALLFALLGAWVLLEASGAVPEWQLLEPARFLTPASQ